MATRSLMVPATIKRLQLCYLSLALVCSLVVRMYHVSPGKVMANILALKNTILDLHVVLI